MRRVIALVAAVLFVGAPAYALDETPGENLGGYDGVASAVALSFQPNFPALVSTGDVPFEGSFAIATGRVKSGGNALARGALIWPGATLADFGPVLGVAFGQPEIGAMIPKWPLQAEATQDSGEVITGAPPVATMRAFGALDQATGDSRIADIHLPRVVHIEHIASTSDTKVTDGGVNATGIVKLQGVSLLAGFIKAEEIRSISRTSSIGSAASSSGDVDVIGLKIGGIDVSVTDDGFQVTGLPPDAAQFPGAGGEPFPGQSPEEAVNSILDSLGARITMFKSTSKVVGAGATRTQPGLIVSVDNPAGGQGPIPPGRFDIILGSTSATTFATLPFTADVASGSDTSIGTGADSGGATSSVSGETDSISIGGGAEVSDQTLTSVGEDLSEAAEGSLGAVGTLEDTTERSDYKFAGLPLGLVLGFLALALLVSRYIRNAYAGLLSRGSDNEGDTE